MITNGFSCRPPLSPCDTYPRRHFAGPRTLSIDLLFPEHKLEHYDVAFTQSDHPGNLVITIEHYWLRHIQ